MSVTASNLLGQQLPGKIYGDVKKGNEPVPYATIKLLAQKDSAMVKGLVADEGGAFEFRSVAAGNYLLAFSSVSATSLYFGPFTIDSLHTDLNTGTIILTDKIQTLQEVQITGNRSLLERKGSKLIVNIQNSFLAPGNVVMEVLPNLPGISYRNNRLLLNGKPVLLLIDNKGEYNSKNVLETLNSLSAEQVEKIEIISNAPAKYEGSVQGVINIVLKKKYNVSTARLNSQSQLYPTRDFNGLKFNRTAAGFTLNAGTKKISTSTSIDLAKRSSIEIIEESTRYEGVQNVSSSSDHREREEFISYRTDLQWNLDGKATETIGVALSGFYSFRNTNEFNSTLNFNVTENDPQVNSTLYSYNVSNAGGSSYNNVTLYYSKRIGEKGNQLDVVADVYRRNLPTRQTYENFLVTSSLDEQEFIANQKSGEINGAAANINYRLKLTEKYDLEVGSKISRFENLTDQRYQVLGDSLTTEGVSSFNYQYGEKIMGGYATLTRHHKHGDLEFGLRAENVLGEGMTSASENAIDIQYFQLYPSFNFNYTTDKNLDYQFSLSRRIARRPSFNELNRAADYRGPLTIFTGNPGLKGQISNSAMASVIISSLYSISLGYDLDQNVRAVIPVMNPDKPFSFEVVNVNQAHTTFVDLNVPYTVSSKWKMVLNAAAYNNRWNAARFAIRTNSSYYTASLSNDYRFSDKLQTQFVVDYSSPNTMGFDYSYQILTTRLSVNAAIFKKAGTFSFVVNDLLGTSKWKSTQTFFGQYYRSSFPVTNQRSVMARLTFNIKTGEQRKRVSKQSKNFGELRMN